MGFFFFRWICRILTFPHGISCWVTRGDLRCFGSNFPVFPLCILSCQGTSVVKAALCKMWVFSSSNGSGGNSLQVQNSLGCAFEIPGTGGREIQGYPGIQSAQFGIQGWSMGRVDPHFCLSLDWEFRSCKLNSNRSFLRFKSLKKSTQGWLGKHLRFCGET